MNDFQKDVIDKSFDKPVVVDFWAPWCGPCLALGPVIEQLAEEQKELWDLVKLNTEENEAIASQYSVRSIPNVKLFYRGEVLDEFLGALPRSGIQQWLQRVLPKPGVIALDHLLTKEEVPQPEDLERLIDQYPDIPEIRIVLSQLLLWDNPQRALDVLDTIKMGTPLYDKATYLRDIASFLLLSTEDEVLLNIKSLLMTAHLEKAILEVIQALSKDNKLADGKLAKAAIGIFNTLGTQHPLTKTYRKQLDMHLWT